MAVRGSGRTVMEPEQTGMRHRARDASRPAAQVRDAVDVPAAPRTSLTAQTHPYRTILACGLDDDTA